MNNSIGQYPDALNVVAELNEAHDCLFAFFCDAR